MREKKMYTVFWREHSLVFPTAVYIMNQNNFFAQLTKLYW